MRLRPNLFAGVAATLVVFIAVAPWYYAKAMAHWKLPAPPDSIVLLFALGIPGGWFARAVGGFHEDRWSLPVALGVNWIIYFLVFRGIAKLLFAEPDRRAN